jgi:hypothetical protein
MLSLFGFSTLFCRGKLAKKNVKKCHDYFFKNSAIHQRLYAYDRYNLINLIKSKS